MKCIHCKHFGGLIYLFLFFLNGFQAQVNTCDHQNKWLKYAATCSTSTRMPEVFDAAWDQWYGEASSCPDDAALLTPYYWKSRYFRAQARYDSAMYYVLKAEKIALYIKDGPLAKLYWRNTFEKGKVLLALSEFDLGVEVHVEYLNYAQNQSDPFLLAEAYQGLAVAFRYAQKPRMAMAYSRKAEEIARRIGAESLLANSLDNIGNCFYDILTEYEFPSKEIGIQDSALVCFNEAFEIMNRRNDVASLILNLGNMAGIYEAKKDYRYALKLMVSANEYAKINSAADDIGNTYSNIAAMYLQLQNFDSCGIYLDSARKYHAMHLDKRLLLSTYMLGAYLALDQGDYKTAYEQEVLRSALSDSLRNAKSKMKINYLELMMLTEDQRSELESKTASLQLTRLVVLASCICLVLLVIIGWQFFKSQRRRSMEKLTQQEQRATLQIMQSEQAERIRIARELHDGLGQPLSVAKMYLSHYNDADKPRELIDLAIQEVRGISHRLMPESLQLGLHAALESLALQVSEAGVLNCHYQGNIGDSIGQIPKETEVSLYRIAQEVINNSIKHAGAAHIQMVCTIDKEQLTLTIDDDGKGIDRQAVDNSKGIGWMNVYARAKGIDAVVDIHRRTKGTEVIVKLKLI